MMKKKMMIVLAICAMAVMVTACGSKSDTKATTTAAGTTAAGAAAEASGEAGGKGESAEPVKETTKAVETTVDEEEAKGPGATTAADSDGEAVVDQENKNYEDLESSDYEGFAKQVVDTVKAKDMNALADLLAYPAYVSCVKDNDGIVNTKEEFMAQDPEEIFDQSLVDAMDKADLSDLTPLMTGVVIGDDTPNIIFNSVDGKLGITGINY